MYVGEGENLHKIFSAHLKKFIMSNLALKRLEFANMQLRTLELALLPALNCCLSVLYQQGRALVEIVMTLVQFDDVKYIEEFCTRLRHLLHSYGTAGLTMTADIDRYVATI